MLAPGQPDPAAFANIAPREFEAAVTSLLQFAGTAAESEPQLVKLLADALRAISRCSVLGAREQDRRASVIVGAHPEHDGALRDLAVLAHQLAPAVRNAIARALPTAYRQMAFSTVLAASMPEAAHAPRSPLASGMANDGETPQSGQVLLVGTYQEHDHNIRMLERENLRWIRAKSPGEASALLNEGVIAIALARSCWRAIPPSEHGSFLEQMCRFSTFAFLKVDTTGFSNPGGFDRICSTARSRGPDLSEVSHGDSANFAETDLPHMRTAAEAFATGVGAHLYPVDIPPHTARILIAAVAKHVNGRHFPNPVRVTAIGTKTLQSGQSQALLVAALPDDDGPPLVIKIAAIESLREEISRFFHFILPSEGFLKPTLHVHGADGLVVFGLVDMLDQPRTPAPTLEQHFQLAVRAETGSPVPALSREALDTIVQRTIQRVVALNSRRCPNSPFSSLAWMTLEPLDEAMKKGLRWKFQVPLRGEDPLALARSAVEVLESHRLLATVHGDLHLRNVLVRDAQEPFLIDYAYSGPGHPCFDLVWFESAVLFRFFRAMSPEDRLVALFSRLLTPYATLRDLAAEFPVECAPVVNKVAIQAALTCKQHAEELLKLYGAPAEHYLAMKLLVACQSLIRPDVQAGVVRAMVSAVAAAAVFR